LNIGEAITIAIAICRHPNNSKVRILVKHKVPKVNLLLPHLDDGNCPEIPKELIAYKHVMSHGVLVRASVIFYWKKGVADNYRRLGGARQMKEDVRSYFNTVWEKRLLSLSIKVCSDASLYQDGNPLLPRKELSHMEKTTGSHSTAAHCFRELTVDKKPQWFKTIESICEVLFPFGFLVSYANIYTIYYGWARQNAKPKATKTGILSLEVFNELVATLGTSTTVYLAGIPPQASSRSILLFLNSKDHR
jgi:hypothetical protein